jgi:transposase
MSKHRRQYTAQEKMSILRRYLVDRVPVSDLCDELGLQPTVFYRWQKTLFENGASALENRSNGRSKQSQERKVAALETKLREAGLLRKWNGQPSCKGRGFHQPRRPHAHWHVDIAYVNICGTFYYLCSVLDGYSTAQLHE